MKLIKRLFGACLLLLVFAQVKAQNTAPSAIDKYFKQYVEDERFSVVYISSKLFELIGQFKVDNIKVDDDEAKAFMDVVKETRGLRILSTDETPRKFYEEAKQKIQTSEYEVLMTVRDNRDKEDVEFLVRQNGNTIQELFLLVGGEDSFTMMSFIGNINLKSISNLAKSMEDDNH